MKQIIEKLFQSTLENENWEEIEEQKLKQSRDLICGLGLSLMMVIILLSLI